MDDWRSSRSIRDNRGSCEVKAQQITPKLFNSTTVHSQAAVELPHPAKVSIVPIHKVGANLALVPISTVFNVKIISLLDPIQPL